MLYFILYWIIYSGLISIYLFRSEWIGLVPDILIFYLSLRTLHLKNNTLSIFVGKATLMFISLFLLLGTVVTFIHLTSFPVYVWGLRMIVRYFLLFRLVFILMTDVDVLKTKIIIYKAMKFNILLCLFQYFVLGVKGDPLGGTFAGGNSEILYLIMFSLFLMTGDYFAHSLSKRKYIFYIVGMSFIAVVGEIKFLYFIIPLFIYIGYVLIRKFSIYKLMVLGVALMLFVPVLSTILSFYYDEQYINNLFDQEHLEEYTTTSSFVMNGEGFNRGSSIELTNTIILQDDIHRLFGYGLGSASASNIFHTWIYNQYKGTTYFLFTPSFVMIETGWIGMSLFLLFHICILWRFWNFYKSSPNSYIKYWSSMGLMFSILTIFIMYYNSYPYSSYCFGYFFWGICMVAIRLRSKELATQVYQ